MEGFEGTDFTDGTERTRDGREVASRSTALFVLLEESPSSRLFAHDALPSDLAPPFVLAIMRQNSSKSSSPLPSTSAVSIAQSVSSHET